MSDILMTWTPADCPVCKGAELVWYGGNGDEHDDVDTCRHPKCIEWQKAAWERWETANPRPTPQPGADDIPF
jgi:hypothetical protein